MLVRYDRVGTYIELSDEKQVQTVEISDLVMVDVDELGRPVGVEFAVPPAKISERMRLAVADHFPDLKDMMIHPDWLLAKS